ncbi:MAG: hypothetical protein HC945_00855 [Nitrosarchaeum sp.]|nr:hypothetical protein [Nitrosarchaeum sp.]
MLGINEYIDRDLARKAGFHIQPDEPAEIVPAFITSHNASSCRIYHAKPTGSDLNIVIAEVYDSLGAPTFYLGTFRGPDPLDIQDLREEQSAAAYHTWRGHVHATIRPDLRTPGHRLTHIIESALADAMSQENYFDVTRPIRLPRERSIGRG